MVTDDGLVIGGSEAGMVSVDEAAISEKGAPGPGQMLAVDTKVHRFLRDRDLKDELAASQPFGDRVNSITNLEETIGTVREQALYAGEELRRRQAAAGYTIEDLEMILHPMGRGCKGSRCFHGRWHASRGAFRRLRSPQSLPLQHPSGWSVYPAR